HVSLQTQGIAPNRGYTIAAELDLLGELQRYGTPDAQFQRGVVDHPAIGDDAIPIGSNELRLAFTLAASSVIEIGHLHQDRTIKAHIDVDNMLNKHFAVLGSTGVGKSSGVALILHQVLTAR